jgi:hypothetical protein
LSRSFLKEAFVRGTKGLACRPDAARVFRRSAEGGRARARTIVTARIPNLARGRVL